MKARYQQSTKAFSLVEIMVAVTLLSFITVGLLAMFYHTQRAFRVGTSQVDVLEGGRATLRLLAMDLQEMYPSRIDHVVNLEAVPASGFRYMPLANGAALTNLFQDVAFLTRKGDEWFATSYRVDHINGAGTLYRCVISTNMASLFMITNASDRASITTFKQVEMVSNLFWAVTRPAVPNITNASNLTFDRVADGVVHFRIHAYDDRGIRLVETNTPYARQWNDVYHFTNWVPEYVDIELAILDPKGMEQHRAREGVPANAETYLERQGYRTHMFHQRVPIRSRREEFDLFAGQ